MIYAMKRKNWYICFHHYFQYPPLTSTLGIVIIRQRFFLKLVLQLKKTRIFFRKVNILHRQYSDTSFSSKYINVFQKKFTLSKIRTIFLQKFVLKEIYWTLNEVSELKPNCTKLRFALNKVTLYANSLLCQYLIMIPTRVLLGTILCRLQHNIHSELKTKKCANSK